MFPARNARSQAAHRARPAPGDGARTARSIRAQPAESPRAPARAALPRSARSAPAGILRGRGYTTPAAACGARGRRSLRRSPARLDIQDDARGPQPGGSRSMSRDRASIRLPPRRSRFQRNRTNGAAQPEFEIGGSLVRITNFGPGHPYQPPIVRSMIGVVVAYRVAPSERDRLAMPLTLAASALMPWILRGAA